MLKIEQWKSKGNGPWIVLRLEPSKSNEDVDLRLAEIIFRPHSGCQILYRKIPNELWTKYNGCRAIAIFLLLAAAKRTKPVNPEDDVLICETPVRPSWPNSFSELIQQKKFEDSGWLQRIFGLEMSQKSHASQQPALDNGLALIARKEGRAAKAAKNNQDVQRVLNSPKPSVIKLFLKAHVLDPRKIFIIKGVYADPADQGLTSSEELVRLATVLESGDSGWWKILKEENLPKELKLAPDAVEASPTALANGVTAVPNAVVANQPLSETFKTLSVASIKSHLIAALQLGRGGEAIEKSLAEILSPQCINVIAERLVSESVDSFCDFYWADYDSPPNIKKSIAAVLAVNRELRKKLAAMVARSGYRDMLGWFQVFSFFCDREIVIDVEHELMAAENELGFKDEFFLFAPSHLPQLIKIFSNYGCVTAVRIFEKINEEGRLEEAKINEHLYGNQPSEKS